MKLKSTGFEAHIENLASEALSRERALQKLANSKGMRDAYVREIELLAQGLSARGVDLDMQRAAVGHYAKFWLDVAAGRVEW